MKHLVIAAALVFASASMAAGQTWAVTQDIATPESVYIDPVSGSIFVSNINGNPPDRDGNGYISRLDAGGKVVAAKWATGLNAPKGLRSLKGTLWVSDLDEVVAMDIASGRVTSRVKIEGARFLNDVAVAPDGTVYVSDSQGYKIFQVKDGKSSIFAEGEAVEVPNGVLVDGSRLIVASLAQAPGENAMPGRVFALDLKTKQKTLLSQAPIGRLDGLEIDGRGGFIVSDVGTGRILQVTGGAARVLRELGGATADIAYNAARKIVIVPHLRENKVAAYDLSDTVK